MLDVFPFFAAALRPVFVNCVYPRGHISHSCHVFNLYNIYFLITCYLNFDIFIYIYIFIIIIIYIFIYFFLADLMNSALMLLSDDQAGFRTSACLMHFCLPTVCSFQSLLCP